MYNSRWQCTLSIHNRTVVDWSIPKPRLFSRFYLATSYTVNKASETERKKKKNYASRSFISKKLRLNRVIACVSQYQLDARVSVFEFTIVRYVQRDAFFYIAVDRFVVR